MIHSKKYLCSMGGEQTEQSAPRAVARLDERRNPLLSFKVVHKFT